MSEILTSSGFGYSLHVKERVDLKKYPYFFLHFIQQVIKLQERAATDATFAAALARESGEDASKIKINGTILKTDGFTIIGKFESGHSGETEARFNQIWIEQIVKLCTASV